MVGLIVTRDYKPDPRGIMFDFLRTPGLAWDHAIAAGDDEAKIAAFRKKERLTFLLMIAGLMAVGGVAIAVEADPDYKLTKAERVIKYCNAQSAAGSPYAKICIANKLFGQDARP